jgi:DNA modification methylase
MSDIKDPNLCVELRPIDQIKSAPHNPRKHSERQIKQIAVSIQSFGFNVPVLVKHDNEVVAGEGRVKAAKQLGLQEIPVIRLEHLTEAQARAFMVADNRLSEVSEWDDQLLGQLLKELSELELDFSLEATGFSAPEIDLRIEGVSSDDEPDPADKIIDVNEGPPISKVGDLWHLDAHSIMCANALEAESYNKLMQGDRAAMVFCDPPYNQKIYGHVSGKGRIHHREFVMASGEMTREQFTAFLAECSRLMVAYSIDGAIEFICMDWQHIEDLLAATRLAKLELKNICVWVKNNAGMGSLYRSRHEFILVFKNGTAPHRNNIELGRHGRNRTNVWEYSGANGFGRQSDEGNLSALHPTVKPVRMIADAMLDCSARGDIVLDPFLGSGSTLIAAERVGRTCRGIELDPLYVDVAIRRWQAYTGDSAVQAGTGKCFNELAAKVSHG